MSPTRRRMLGGLALLPLAAAAQTRSRTVTVTRQVRRFLELETALHDAQRAGDVATLERLLADDYELRAGRRPGQPVARADWLAEIRRQPPPEVVLEQMAVHDRGDTAAVSFLARPEGGGAPLFVVDLWLRAGDDWKLQVRYATPVGRDAAVPGEAPAATLPKK